MSATEQNAIAGAVAHGKSRTITETLDHWKPRLEAFLTVLPESRGPAAVEDLRLPGDGGASSGTIMFTARYGDGRREKLVLRYHPETGHAHEYDMIGQYHILKSLHGSGVPAPRVLALDDSGKYFGVPGFVMHHIEGKVLPATYPIEGPLFDAAPETRRQMMTETMAAMAKLHRLDWQALNVAKHTRKGKGGTWLERDIDWYLTALRWGCPDQVAAVLPAAEWLLAHQYEPPALALCHGDCSLHNYMYQDGHLAAMLDWEFAFIGMPEVDLAFQMLANDTLSLGHPPLEGMPDANERKAIYEGFAGRKLQNWDYCLAVGALKIYTHMALTFRDVPPEIAPARDKYIGFNRDRLMQHWEAAKR